MVQFDILRAVGLCVIKASTGRPSLLWLNERTWYPMYCEPKRMIDVLYETGS